VGLALGSLEKAKYTLLQKINASITTSKELSIIGMLLSFSMIVKLLQFMKVVKKMEFLAITLYSNKFLTLLRLE
jgi:hypothetical protein